MAEPPRDERSLVSWFARHSGSPPTGDTWVGDDTAVLNLAGGAFLFATDSVVEGVHFLAGEELSDVGWKALARNVSDVAAMGGTATHAVAAVSGATPEQIVAIHEGLLAAAETYHCPVVGGDVARGEGIVVTVAILGEMVGEKAVLRSGGAPGDAIYCTGPLGSANAGLRLLKADRNADGPLVSAHCRPIPRVAEGRLAAVLGASAMIDVSDGFVLDLHRLADASGVGFSLDDLPVAPGATEEDALSGGDDYELIFAIDPSRDIVGTFVSSGLRAPFRVGTLVASPATRELHGRELPPAGWRHDLDDRL